MVFTGRPARAGINPEDGRSAIVAAARAISDLRLGRIDDETTANAGLIEGGSALNVVPERCRLAVEARSRDEEKLSVLVQEMVDCFAFAASLSECEVETTIEDKYRGYRLAADDPALALARAALSVPASSRARSRRGEAPTRTSSSSAGCTASTWPTA